MDSSANEHGTTGPTMDVIELLIAVAGPEEQREDGVLRPKQEDHGELG